MTSLHVDAGQYAVSSGAPTLGSAFTLAIWFRPTTFDAGSHFSLGQSVGSDYAALVLEPTGGAYFETNGSGTATTASSANLTDTVWSHIAGVQASTTSRVHYKDGVAGATNTTSSNPSSLNRITAGALTLNGVIVSTGQGDLAHAAIWSIALSAGEVASLAAGALPSSVQPGSLVFYSVLDGVASPEEDTIGGRHLAWGAGANAPTQSSSNPPVSGTATLERSAALGATAAIATSASFFSTLERAVVLAGTAAMSVVPQRDILRSTALGATGAIATGRQVVRVCSAALAATAAVTVTIGGSTGRLEGSGGVSGLIE